MKRSALVAAGTVAGVTAVVSYHAVRPSTGLTGLAAVGTRSSTTTSSSSTRSSSGARSQGRRSGTRSAATAHHHARTGTGTTTTAASGSAARSAVGQAINYPYGDLQVKVTEHHGRITDVSIARFQIPDAQSVSIDQYAVPRLRAEVLAAQSAHIDGISGASFTAQAYAQSVQSAIDRLS